QSCSGSQSCTSQGEFTDHPSIAVLTRADGTSRVVACWVDSFSAGGNGSVYTAYSDDGQTWSPRATVGGPSGAVCSMGGTASQIAVSWQEAGLLKFRTSTDGQNWSRPVVLAEAGQLFQNLSTTTQVLSVPYLEIVPGNGALRALFQVRKNNQSQ